MMSGILLLVAMMLGCAFGSFLNVVLSRLPAGESVLWPPSHCRGCARQLAWWENVPVASYLVLRGRCRTCRSLIGIRSLLVELASGLTAAAVTDHWMRTGAAAHG